MKYLFLLPLLAVGCTSNTTEETVEEPKKIELAELWSTDSTSLLTPESVLFDVKRNQIYVSCINGVPPSEKDGDGYLAILHIDGSVKNAKWISGFDAPKGMGMQGNTLYVTDITSIKLIDIEKGEVIQTIEVPNAAFLNDVDVDANGTVYFTDSNTSTVYTLSKEGTVEVFLQNDELGGSNGVLVDQGKLLIAGFGSGAFHQLHVADRSLTKLADSLMGGDGIVKYMDGYLVSNWNGEISYTENGTNSLLLDTKEAKRNAADIALMGENIVLVPEFFANKVTAYTIK